MTIYDIFSAANRGISAAAYQGFVATEILLGPEEMKAFEEGAKQMEKDGLTRPSAALSGKSIFGMNVIEMKEPGMRIGTTLKIQ